MKAFTAKIGGVEVFTGSLDDAMEVVAASVAKPRLPIAKEKVLASPVGTKFKINSKVKGGGSATLELIEIIDEFTIAQIAMEVEELVIQEAKVVVAAAPVKPISKQEAPKSSTKTKEGKTPAGLKKDAWDYMTSVGDNMKVTNVVVFKKTEKKYEVLVNSQVVWYFGKRETAKVAADALQAKYQS